LPSENKVNSAVQREKLLPHPYPQYEISTNPPHIVEFHGFSNQTMLSQTNRLRLLVNCITSSTSTVSDREAAAFAMIDVFRGSVRTNLRDCQQVCMGAIPSLMDMVIHNQGSSSNVNFSSYRRGHHHQHQPVTELPRQQCLALMLLRFISFQNEKADSIILSSESFRTSLVNLCEDQAQSALLRGLAISLIQTIAANFHTHPMIISCFLPSIVPLLQYHQHHQAGTNGHSGHDHDDANDDDSHAAVHNSAVKLIGNLAYNPECRESLITSGVVDSLVREQNSRHTLAWPLSAAIALSNLFEPHHPIMQQGCPKHVLLEIVDCLKAAVQNHDYPPGELFSFVKNSF
jgi:hypothetical protein